MKHKVKYFGFFSLVNFGPFVPFLSQASVYGVVHPPYPERQLFLPFRVLIASQVARQQNIAPVIFARLVHFKKVESTVLAPGPCTKYMISSL